MLRVSCFELKPGTRISQPVTFLESKSQLGQSILNIFILHK